MKFNRYALSDLATIKYGKNQKKVLSESGNIPIYGTGGLMGYATTALYDKPSVLIGRKGTIGKVKYVEYPFWTVDTLFYTIVNTDIVFPKYLYYVMSLIDLNNYNEGTTIPSLRTETLNRLEFDIPSLVEQETILSCLNPIDEKIALNNAINNNLEEQAASIFTKWLSTCADASTIGDMSYNILDYSPVGSEQIRLLNSSDVTEGVFPIAPLVPNKDLKGHFKKRFKFGDILYSEIRPRNHHYGFVLFDASDYIASTRLMVIRAIENKVSPAMLYQYLLLPEVEAEFTLKTESRSGTFPQGNYADMASIRVPYSPTDSQVAISETLTQIRYTIAQNQLESQRLAELRDTLLPKLMSGELDVSAVEI